MAVGRVVDLLVLIVCSRVGGTESNRVEKFVLRRSGSCSPQELPATRPAANQNHSRVVHQIWWQVCMTMALLKLCGCLQLPDLDTLA